jgi:hypothetical protein
MNTTLQRLGWSRETALNDLFATLAGMREAETNLHAVEQDARRRIQAAERDKYLAACRLANAQVTCGTWVELLAEPADEQTAPGL